MDPKSTDSIARAIKLLEDVLLFGEMPDDELRELYDAVKPFEEYCYVNGVLS